MLRLLRNLFIVCALTAVSVGALAFAWRQIGGAALTIHGGIALTLGVLGTIALAWGLMALAFKSSREGWDDRVGDTDHDDKP